MDKIDVYVTKNIARETFKYTTKGRRGLLKKDNNNREKYETCTGTYTSFQSHCAFHKNFYASKVSNDLNWVRFVVVFILAGRLAFKTKLLATAK